MNIELRQRLQSKLREQLEFIRASCIGFDAGMRSEAIRIAAGLRILFHDGKSLVSQLGARNLRLLSTQGGPPPEFLAMIEKLSGGSVDRRNLWSESLVMARSNGAGEVKLVPPLGDGPMPPLPIGLEEWLAETIYQNPKSGPLTRHQLFKWAANKDGGAHVDLEGMPAAYAGYSAPDAYSPIYLGQDAPIEELHLVALRQLGYEVLNSPELVALGGAAGGG